MRTQQLECFVQVVKQKSFVRAAKLLYLSQPAITQQVAALEKELGFKLLDRSGRQVELTEAGAHFYENALQILSRLNKSVLDAQRIAQTAPQRLAIAYSDIIADILLEPTLRELAVAHPEVEFRYAVGTPFELMDGLMERNYDLVFLSRADTQSAAYDFIPLVTLNYCFALAAASPFAQHSGLSLDDLLRSTEERFERLILPRFNSYSPTYNDFLHRLRQEYPRLKVSFENNFRVALLLASFGRGVTIFPGSPAFATANTVFVPLVPTQSAEFGLAFTDQANISLIRECATRMQNALAELDDI